MVPRLKSIDLSQIQTGSVRRRKYRLAVQHLAKVPDPTQPLVEFFKSLPRTGDAARLLEAAETLARAALDARPIVWMIDGTLTAQALSPLLVYLMRRNLVQCLGMNGEVALHDYEFAFHGAAVEDPAAGLPDGVYGLARETAEGINAIVNEGVKRGFSIGECLGRGILERQPRHFSSSMLATGAARLIPTTVHVNIGAEGFHRYPGADGAMLGKGSLKDTHILSSFIAALPAGALLVSLHRDQGLSQVLLHSMAMARNLNDQLGGLSLIQLQAPDDRLEAIPWVDRHLKLDGSLSIMLPLLVGALFTLVE